jgi:hypothetical protein
MENEMKTIQTIARNVSIRTYPSGSALDGRALRCRLLAAERLNAPLDVERIGELFADSRLADEAESEMDVAAAICLEADDATPQQKESAKLFRRVRQALFSMKDVPNFPSLGGVAPAAHPERIQWWQNAATQAFA